MLCFTPPSPQPVADRDTTQILLNGINLPFESIIDSSHDSIDFQKKTLLNTHMAFSRIKSIQVMTRNKHTAMIRLKIQIQS